MVEQEKVGLVVMLCKVQPGFSGCSQYFPDREFHQKLVHGDSQVETEGAVSHRSVGGVVGSVSSGFNTMTIV